MSVDRPRVPAVVETAVLVETSTLQSSLGVPMMLANAGDRAARRFLDFFAASIENDNTRMAYYRAVCHSSSGSSRTASASSRISSRSMSPRI